MRLRSAVPRSLAAAAATLGTVVGLLAVPAAASPPTAQPAHLPAAHQLPAAPTAAVLPPRGAANQGDAERFAERSQALPAAQRAQPAARAAASASKPAARVAKTATPTAAQTCNASDFTGRSGSSLAAYVAASTTDCINSLFSLTGANAAGAFKQAQMLPVATALNTAARRYDGTDASGIQQLVLFLRAGYYAQFYDPQDVGQYDASLATATRTALDSFFAGPHALDVTAANGDVLAEAITLTDSAVLQDHYLGTYKRLMAAYTSSWDAVASMTGALNNVFMAPLWRGNQNPAFVSAVTADPSIVDALNSFTRANTRLLSTDNDVMDANAGLDMTRLVGYPALQAKVRPLAQGLLGISQITGPTARLWVEVANQAYNYDGDNCSYYGVCNLADRLTAAALPQTLACDNRTVMAQSLSAADLNAVCASLRNQDPYFHRLVKDNGPIPGQYESSVRMAVFASQRDYAIYSSPIFGNDTNNGGETLTGDPADPNNKPVSIEYQKPYDDGFVARVWNLNHEYTHYLDGVYNTKGTFAQETVVPDIWYVEGLAEYVSYSYRGVSYDDATAQAALHTYKLSDLWQTQYGDTTRVYNWGYLAVRYMFEKHPADMANMLSHFRTGDYAGGAAVYLTGIGTRYDADFDNWLNACAAGACQQGGNLANGGFETGSASPWTTTGTATVVNSATHSGGYALRLGGTSPTNGDSTAAQTFTVPSGSTQLSFWYDVACPDRVQYDWATATLKDNTAGTSTTVLDKTCAANSGWTQAKTPVTAGHSYTLTLASHDDDYAGDPTYTAFDDVVLGAPVSLPACTGNSYTLGQNCSLANQSASAGGLDYLDVYLPAGTSTLTVTTSGGSGDADLLYNASTWANSSNATTSSTGGGTEHSITVSNTAAGWRYVSLYGRSAFSGVTVSAQF
ncbi:collagenase [Streptomyces tateyamensis]|uniref:microbial collagenase n=1 Tax=Streptomyces tateyamensis TaxID=565073 RepID=A0A2V4PB18_9ACTN|nr:collagenase [Streptomyces tateyamensis]PYC88401.1 collagenase [Streptomyces tateyamensis]